MWTQDKHILITGASGGIGRELCLNYMGVCRKLTLVARNRGGSLDALAERLRAEPAGLGPPERAVRTEVDVRALDVLDRRGVAALVRDIYEEAAEQVDAFVNCAGGTHRYAPLEEMSDEDVERIFDVNGKAPIFWLRELLPRMKRNELGAGDQKRAHVLMISSRSGERALPNLSVYAAAKASVERLIEGVRCEYARHRIAFTLVNPGSVNTAFTEQWPAPVRDAHNAESMDGPQAVSPIVQALDSQFVFNKLSYESVEQWTGEPGILRDDTSA